LKASRLITVASSVEMTSWSLKGGASPQRISQHLRLWIFIFLFETN
jgi:hypothetical protein